MPAESSYRKLPDHERIHLTAFKVDCLQERNPEALLHPFMSVLAAHGLGFQQALFVPPESSYRKLGSTQQHQDLSWQHGLQRVYQSHLSTNLKVSFLPHLRLLLKPGLLL